MSGRGDVFTKESEREKTMEIDAVLKQNRWVACLLLIVAMLLGGCGVKTENDQTVVSDAQAMFESWDRLIETAKQRIPQAKAIAADIRYFRKWSISFMDNDVKRTNSARNPLVGECMLDVTHITTDIRHEHRLFLRVTFVPDGKSWRFLKCEDKNISVTNVPEDEIFGKDMFLPTKNRLTYLVLATLFDMPTIAPKKENELN